MLKEEEVQQEPKVGIQELKVHKEVEVQQVQQELKVLYQEQQDLKELKVALQELKVLREVIQVLKVHKVE